VVGCGLKSERTSFEGQNIDFVSEKSSSWNHAPESNTTLVYTSPKGALLFEKGD
jgi:hypothetical protein